MHDDVILLAAIANYEDAALYIQRQRRAARSGVLEVTTGAAPPAHAVQFNDPFGSFNGTTDFLWVTGLGSGLTIGGATVNAGVVTPGAGEHIAVGNYAIVDQPDIFPGGGGEQAVLPQASDIVICSFYSGDFSVNAPAGMTAYNGFKNTSASQAQVFYGIDVKPGIVSSNVNPCSSIQAGFFSASNFGTGAVGEITGIVGTAIQNNFYHAGTSATFMSGGQFQTWLSGTITNAYGVLVLSPFLVGVSQTVAGNYGLFINDQSTAGSTRSYNIFSANPGYAVTPASTAGGHLFAAHSAMGNWADVDVSYFAPNDPVNGSTSPILSILTLSDFASANNFIGLVVSPGFVSDGTAFNQFFGAVITTAISSTSTLDIFNIGGLQFEVFNYGSGNVTNAYGIFGNVEHFGAGTIDLMIGVQGVVSLAGPATEVAAFYAEFSSIGTGTNVYSFFAATPFKISGTVTNMYGLYLNDHSGVGSTISENIRSKGATSRNTFEGTLNFGTATNTPQDGDVWFDGTSLKLRTGGVTKTITAV